MERMLSVLRESTHRVDSAAAPKASLAASKYTTAAAAGSSVGRPPISPQRRHDSVVGAGSTPSKSVSTGLAPMTVDDFRVLRDEYRHRLASSKVDSKGFVQKSNVLAGPRATSAVAHAVTLASISPQVAPSFDRTARSMASSSEADNADHLRHQILLQQIAHSSGGVGSMSPLIKTGLRASQPAAVAAVGGDRKIQEWSEHVLKYHPLAGRYAQGDVSSATSSPAPILLVPASRFASPAPPAPFGGGMLSPGSHSTAATGTLRASSEYIPVSLRGIEETFRDLTPRRGGKQTRDSRRPPGRIEGDADMNATTTIDVTPIPSSKQEQAASSQGAAYFLASRPGGLAQQSNTSSGDDILADYRRGKREEAILGMPRDAASAHSQSEQQRLSSAHLHVPPVVVQAIPVPVAQSGDAYDPIYMSPTNANGSAEEHPSTSNAAVVVAAVPFQDVVSKYLPPHAHKAPAVADVVAVDPQPHYQLSVPYKPPDPSNPPSVGEVRSRISAVRSLVAARAVEQIEAVERHNLVQAESLAVAWVVLRLEEEFCRREIAVGWERSSKVIHSLSLADRHRISAIARHQGDVAHEEQLARQRLEAQSSALLQQLLPQVEQLKRAVLEQTALRNQERDGRVQQTRAAASGLSLLKSMLLELVEEAERRELVAGRYRPGLTCSVVWCDESGRRLKNCLGDDPLFPAPRRGTPSSAEWAVLASGYDTPQSVSGLPQRADCFGWPLIMDPADDPREPYYLCTLRLPLGCWYREPPPPQASALLNVQQFAMMDLLMPPGRRTGGGEGCFCEVQCSPLEYFSLVRPILQFVFYESLHRLQLEHSSMNSVAIRQIVVWHRAQVRQIDVSVRKDSLLSQESARRALIDAEALMLAEKIVALAHMCRDLESVQCNVMEQEERAWSLLVTTASRSSALLARPITAATAAGASSASFSPDEIFSLADVYNTGQVKLSNLAAVLRMRGICFDLSLISSSFAKAAGSQPAAPGSPPQALSRAQFQHFLSTLRSLQHTGSGSPSTPPASPPQHSPVHVVTTGTGGNWMAGSATRPSARPMKPLTAREHQQARSIFTHFDNLRRGCLDAVQTELGLRSVLGTSRFDSLKMSRSFATHSTLLGGQHYVDFTSFEQVFADMITS
jgi:hypothetical protein